MTDCKQRFHDLVRPMRTVLDDDLAALKRQSTQQRIELYNELKRNESAFQTEYTESCPDFLTRAERRRVRSDFRLARLFVAASFFDDEEMPPPMMDDFSHQALQTVVDLERFKQFDALSESQIEARIRRMDGEVYELVTEYTSTQLASVEELLKNPNVQRDVMERMLDRYETRRQKIRRGFFTYVETHGLEHLVESIEEAVRAVSDASATRSSVAATLQETDDKTVDPATLSTRWRQLEAEIRSVERRDSGTPADATDPEAEALKRERADVESVQSAVMNEIADRLQTLENLQDRVEEQLEQLERAEAAVEDHENDSVRSDAARLIDKERTELRDQRQTLDVNIDQLRREQDRLSIARQRVEHRADGVETDADERGVPSLGDRDAVTSSEARLIELDYLGRVDTSVHETPTIQTPDGSFEIADGYWDGRAQRWDERPRLGQLLDEERAADEYPLNRGIRYEITSSGYLGLTRTREMVLEAMVLSHLEAHARNGFDESPADLDDLLSVVNQAVAEAEAGDYHYLLTIASPTGWTDRVQEQLADRDRSRYSRLVSLCLVDLQTGGLLYDQNDEIARENARLFELTVDDERVDDCVDWITTRYVDAVDSDSVLLETVVEEGGFDPHVVRRAFERLEAEGAGERLHVDEYGLGLEFA